MPYNLAKKISFTTTTGKVTKIGYYSDTLPKLVITIPKSNASELPLRERERMNLPLAMNGETYHAGIRTTTKAKTLTICPDLLDATGNEIRLTDLLLRDNIQQKATVVLSIGTDSIAIIS